MRRRHWLQAALLGGVGGVSMPVPADGGVRRGRILSFPRDHGAHPDTRIEWWYVTGWLGTPTDPAYGFQITFFRHRTGLAADLPGRFAARQLLFAHAALTDLGARRHHHAQRIARWSGDPATPSVHAALHDTGLRIGRWILQRDDGPQTAAYRTLADDDRFGFDLAFAPTQPLLLQGEAGYSRKGPQEGQASHYVSEPQLAVSGRVRVDGRERTWAADAGRAWLDHEWSDEVLAPDAVGWDWVGMNLFDGSALTAFRLRRADGSALWAGGGWRTPGQAAQSFGPQDVRFEPVDHWRSPATGHRYPVRWQLDAGGRRLQVRALLDAQELDASRGTGAVYWEGLAELLDARGRRIGLGYLELTGYGESLRL